MVLGFILEGNDEPNATKGDTISYNIINTKESKTGNLYSNVSSVKVVDGNRSEYKRF